MIAGAHKRIIHQAPYVVRPLRAHEVLIEAPAGPAPGLADYVETTVAFELEPWQQQVCARLERLMSETGQRVLIHGPPQFGKSIIISQRFPAYGLGIDPLHRFRVACYNQTHAERFSKVNQELMRDASYRRTFSTRLTDRTSADEWSTIERAALLDAQPSFKALGLGTGFVGMGADTLIVDDPYKNSQEARSPAINVMLRDWWQQVVLPRLSPDANVVVMFHRWWEGDFAGQLIEDGGWEIMRFPAIADGLAGDPTGRAKGDLLSPRYTAAYLEGLRLTMGTAFEALYQGTPQPAEGNMFKTGKVEFVDAAPAAALRVRRWDVGASDDAGDYTAGVLEAWVAPGITFVEDVRRGQWASDERDRIIRETAELDRARGVVLQLLPQDPGAAGKAQALHFLRLLEGFKVATEIESGDKATRADPLASQWNGGNVRIVRAKWNKAYLEEMFAFPKGRNDDQVDGSSGGYNWLAANRPQPEAEPRSGGYRSF